MNLLRYTIPVSILLHLGLLVALRAEPAADLMIHWGESSVEIEIAPAADVPEAPPVELPAPDPIEELPVEPVPEDIAVPVNPPPEPPPAAPSTPQEEEEVGLEEATALEGNEPPLYPSGPRRRNLEGRLTLRLSIDETGKVVDAVVAESSGVESFDKAALKALSTWSFNPARMGQRTVPSELLVPVEFKLKD